MLIYKLEVEIIGDDWERMKFYFFKSYDEREKFKKEYTKEHTKNGKLIPTISSIHYFDEDTVYERIKDEMTISHYAKLFNTNLKANNKLELEDLQTGMTVWNETQEEYQRVRYISTRDIKNYHWCDGWGNNIESDELYNYKLNKENNDDE